jgi:hypothetical protein
MPYRKREFLAPHVLPIEEIADKDGKKWEILRVDRLRRMLRGIAYDITTREKAARTQRMIQRFVE